MHATTGQRFASRRDAGCELARRVWARLGCDPDRHDVLVLGASAGALMVAAPVAAGIQAELDAVAACPIAMPDRFAHSIGAVTASGPPALVRRLSDRAGLSAAAIDSAVAVARQHARARELAWRGYVAPSTIAGRTVIVVDDGLGIGVNALAVVRHVLRRRPAHLIVATAVCPRTCARTLAGLADEVISVVAPPGMAMAGAFYAHLAPVNDGDVRRLLSARHPNRSNAVPHPSSTLERVSAPDRGTDRAKAGGRTIRA